MVRYSSILQILHQKGINYERDKNVQGKENQRLQSQEDSNWYYTHFVDNAFRSYSGKLSRDRKDIRCE